MSPSDLLRRPAEPWDELHRNEPVPGAWLVRTPIGEYAHFVTLDRGTAEQYAVRMHGTLHPLYEAKP